MLQTEKQDPRIIRKATINGNKVAVFDIGGAERVRARDPFTGRTYFTSPQALKAMKTQTAFPMFNEQLGEAISGVLTEDAAFMPEDELDARCEEVLRTAVSAFIERAQ